MNQMYNFYGPDPKLDTVVALLTIGHYPNVCYHKEKRKVCVCFIFSLKSVFMINFNKVYVQCANVKINLNFNKVNVQCANIKINLLKFNFCKVRVYFLRNFFLERSSSMLLLDS